jgi:hypothetical protein
VKESGSDTPSSATLMEKRSNSVPLRSAESTPIDTPPASHKTAAPIPIESVTGTSLIICGHTGSWLRNE